jgi:hypothetical protein
MRQRFFPVACCLGAAALISMSSAFAQVGAPQMGWVPDGARIRPVYGIPSAAAVGAKIPADQDFSQIAASPARNYVLVSAAESGTVSIYTAEHGLVALDGAGSAPDSVVLSPRGSASALWFSTNSEIQVVTGLPDAPSIRRIDVSFLGSAPGALAVSDDGAWIAGTWKSGTYAFGPNSGVSRLPVEGAAAIAFFQGTHDLASAGASGLQMVTGIDNFAVASTISGSADSSQSTAVAVAATFDNKTLVLVDQSGSVTAIDIASGAATTSGCSCQPAGLFGIGPSTFRLTGLDGGAFKLFDAASGEILFAPLALTETEGAGQ